MARIKSQGTQIFAVINKAILRFSCPTSFSMGDDSFSKIDATCLDADTKDYERGLREPGEGAIGINLDDENASHLQLTQLADSGDKVQWYIGGSQSKTPPTYKDVEGIELPEDRTWWSFEGYVNPATPKTESDSLVKYDFVLVRTSKVVTTHRVIPKGIKK